MKDDEAWVRNWLVNKGYIDEEKLPFEEGKLTEAPKNGDILYLGKRKGKVIKVMADMANVDFGKGDVYGITFSRIKGNKISEGKMNESVIGVKTDRSFKPAILTKALDKAKIKYKFNRLSMTLSVLDLDKKYFETAKKIVDALGLNVMMATEVKIKTINEGKVYYEAGEKWVVYNTKTGKRIPNAGKFWTRRKNAKIFADKQKNAKVASDTWYMDTIYDKKEPTKSKFKKAGEKSGFDMRGLKESPISEKQKLTEDRKAKEYIKSIKDKDEREDERKRMFDDKMENETTDEELKREYDNILSREADLTRIYQNDRTEENWDRLSIFRQKGRNLEKKLAKMGLIDSYLAEIIENIPKQSDSKAYYIYIKEGNKIKQWRVENILNEDFKKGDKVKYIGKRMWRSNLDPKKIYNVQDVVQDGKGGLTIIVNQYPVKAKDLKLAEDKVNFSKKEMTKLHKDGTIKKGGNKYTYTNEGKLEEGIRHWTSTLEDLIAFGFGNLTVKFKGKSLGKVKDFKRLGSAASSITLKTFNYLLKKGGLKYNHKKDKAELGSEASKYKKGSVELTEGKLNEEETYYPRTKKDEKKLKDYLDKLGNPYKTIRNKKDGSVEIIVRGKLDENKNNKVNFVKRLLQQIDMGFGTNSLTSYQISRIIEELFRHKIIQ